MSVGGEPVGGASGSSEDSERKVQIRAAATRCFVQRGYGATRLLDIAREAGLSKGGVYFHYRTKERLFSDILKRHLGRLRERWSFEPVEEGEPSDALRRLVEAHLHTLTDDPDEGRLACLIVTIAFREPDFRREVEDAESLVRELYARVITRGMRTGSFPPSDANALATSAVALVRGLASAASVTPSGGLPIPADLASKHVLHMVGARCLSARA